MADKDNEVVIKLKADDGASHVVKGLKGGFHELEKGVAAVEHRVSHLVGGIGRTMAMASGLSALGGGILGVGIFEKGMEAARAAAGQEKSIAATLAITDRQGKSYDQLKLKAHGLREEFVEMGISSGNMAETVTDVFREIAERSGKSTGQVVELTKKILDAGRVVGDTEMITKGMRMLESGMVSARNPIVAFIRSTGLLKGNIHEVAAQLQKMAPEKQLELGEKAISRLAAKAKDVQPTFGQMATSMKQMGENILENVGAPIMKSLMPVFQNVQRYILEHRKDIEHWANVVGTKAGQWVTAAAKLMQDAFRWIQTHAEEIKDAISFGANAIKSAIEFMLAHKEVIIAMLTVKGLSGVGVSPTGGPGMAVAAAGIGASIGVAIGNAISQDIAESKYGGKAGVEGLKTLGEAAAQMKLMAERGDKEGIRQLYQELLAQQKARGLIYSEGEGKGSSGGGFREAAHGAAFGAMARANDVLAEKDQQKRLQANEDFKRKFKEASEEATIAGSQDKAFGGGPDAQEHYEKAGHDISGAYRIANEMESAAGQEHVIAILANSHLMRKALVEAGDITGDAFTQLVAKIKTASASAAADITQLDAAKKAENKAPSVTNIGSITNHFNQNFRDADPDRIMVAFKKDLSAQTYSRRQSRTSGPFGL